MNSRDRANDIYQEIKRYFVTDSNRNWLVFIKAHLDRACDECEYKAAFEGKDVGECEIIEKHRMKFFREMMIYADKLTTRLRHELEQEKANHAKTGQELLKGVEEMAAMMGRLEKAREALKECEHYTHMEDDAWITVMGMGDKYFPAKTFYETRRLFVKALTTLDNQDKEKGVWLSGANKEKIEAGLREARRATSNKPYFDELILEALSILQGKGRGE